MTQFATADACVEPLMHPIGEEAVIRMALLFRKRLHLG